LDRPRSTIYLDFSNRNFIDDYREDRKIVQSLLFSLASKVKFPGLPVGNVRAKVEDNFNDFTLPNVVTFLKTYFNISEQDTLMLTLNIDEFQKHISKEDKQFLSTDPRDKSQLFI
jgi:hypothetical protein